MATSAIFLNGRPSIVNRFKASKDAVAYIPRIQLSQCARQISSVWQNRYGPIEYYIQSHHLTMQRCRPAPKKRCGSCLRRPTIQLSFMGTLPQYHGREAATRALTHCPTNRGLPMHTNHYTVNKKRWEGHVSALCKMLTSCMSTQVSSSFICI